MTAMNRKSQKPSLNEASYKPGVTVLTRSLNIDNDEELKAIKSVNWARLGGIEVTYSRNGDVTFKTAKMLTVAKELEKVVDFGATSAFEVLELPAQLHPTYESLHYDHSDGNLNYYTMQRSRCGNDPKRFMQDMTCQSEDPIIKTTMDVWEYRNSARGSLDQIPYYDQDDSAIHAKWYNQNRSPMYEINLDSEPLNSGALAALDRALSVMGITSSSNNVRMNESNDSFVDLANDHWDKIEPMVGNEFFLDDVNVEDMSMVIGAKTKTSSVKHPEKFTAYLFKHDLVQDGFEVRDGKLFMTLKVKK